MNKSKIIVNYLISQALPLQFRKRWKRGEQPPKINIITLFLIAVNIYYPIKQFFKNLKFFMWLRTQNIDEILKRFNFENIKFFHISYK